MSKKRGRPRKISEAEAALLLESFTLDDLATLGLLHVPLRPDEALERAELRSAVDGLFATLPPLFEKLLRRRLGTELRLREAAFELGIAISGAHYHCGRSLVKLRRRAKKLKPFLR